MTYQEVPSSKFYEIVTYLCGRLNEPSLDFNTRKRLLTRLDKILKRRVVFLGKHGLINMRTCKYYLDFSWI